MQTLKKWLICMFLICLGTFPILPFGIKGAVVALLLAIGLIALKGANSTTSTSKVLLFNMGLYILFIISALYSIDLTETIRRLESSVSLILMPLAFILISRNSMLSKQLIKKEMLFKKVFILSTLFLALLIFYQSFQFGDYLNKKIDINALALSLETNFLWMEDHPIYLSIYLSVSMIFIISMLKSASKKMRILLIIAFLTQLFVMILMSKKGVLLAFALSLITYLFTNKHISRKTVFISIIAFIVTIILSIQLLPDTYKRFREVFDVKSYAKVERYSSTSIRYAVYNCSIEVIKKSLLVGHGVGDVKTQLRECYTNTSSILLERNFNTHNQYFSIAISTGIVGLLVFLFSLFLDARLFYSQGDSIGLCLLLFFIVLMLTENILDRQNGVVLFAFFINYYVFKNSNKLSQ